MLGLAASEPWENKINKRNDQSALMRSIVIKFSKRYIRMWATIQPALSLTCLIYHNEFHLYQHQSEMKLNYFD